MVREYPGQTLQATALVHEAWIKLTNNNEQRWQNMFFIFVADASFAFTRENAILCLKVGLMPPVPANARWLLEQSRESIIGCDEPFWKKRRH